MTAVTVDSYGLFAADDLVTPDRSYNQTDWAGVLKELCYDGVVDGSGNELQVIQHTPADMIVIVSTGKCVIQGYQGTVTTARDLMIAAADASLNRIDRAVARVDLTTDRVVELDILTGVPAASPTAPALTRSTDIWEISLAQIAVGAGVTSITTADITSERRTQSVCGYANRYNNAQRTGILSMAGGWASTTLPDGGFTQYETTTNKVNFKSSKFAADASDEKHEHGGILPFNWDGSTIVAYPVFYTDSSSSSGTIIFGLQMRAYASGDSMDAAYGTAQETTYTVASNISYKIIIGSATPAITPAGSPTGGQWLQFRSYRKGSDTFSGDVYLLGWIFVYLTDNVEDV